MSGDGEEKDEVEAENFEEEISPEVSGKEKEAKEEGTSIESEGVDPSLHEVSGLSAEKESELLREVIAVKEVKALQQSLKSWSGTDLEE
jgi:hypothetical protein